MTLFDEGKAYAEAHPKRDGGSWLGFCQSLAWRMCDTYGHAPNPVPSSARAAWKSAGKLTLDASKAPAGAFHYWAIGSDDHVGIDLSGGGKQIMMASNHNTVKWGDGIGYCSLQQYAKAVGSSAKYLGWSLLNGKNGKITKK